MERKKYEVYIYHVANEDQWCEYVLRTNNPREAIEKWADIACKNPTMAAIDTTQRIYALELVTCAHVNKNWFEEICSQPGFPYKWDYISGAIHDTWWDECQSFHEYEYDGEYYPDQVYPFCLG